MSFLGTLGSVVRLMNLPFGFTLTIWSAGAIAINRFGIPSLSGTFLFLVGSIGAYLACAVLCCRESSEEPMALRLQSIAVINVFSIIAAAAVSAVSHLFHDPTLGYAFAGFVGTMTHIMCMSASVCVAWKLRRRVPRGTK